MLQNEEVTIPQVLKRKKELEGELLAHLSNFSTETGVTVTDVILRHENLGRMDGESKQTLVELKLVTEIQG